ncbi:MAG: alpha-L-fucosidase [Lentisphaerae bacterium GWF2_44_16]|nr:MAG: alpha-L-fucosidase [Lentisphaerae bacterium GWF2_44_16]
MAKSNEVQEKYGKGDTKWFVQDRFGMFIHWGLYSQPARHEWVRNYEHIKNEDYEKYFEIFNPDLYEPKEWARMAKNAGMKYFVITTKHHEGFCLWDTKYTDYKAPNTPCGKDLLTPMVKAFRDEGLKVGFYYSLIDWHHSEFPVDSRHPQRDDQEFRKKEKKRDVRKYAEYMHNQVRELLTDFGHIDIMWFDFSYPGKDGKGHEDWQSEKLIKMIRKLQPHIILDDRLDLPGSGDIKTPEQYVPTEGVKDEKGKPLVWEGCQTFSGSWGYHRDENTWKSNAMLIQMLIDHVSKGGNLLLNVGPTARGEFDYRAIEKLSAMGEWMKRHNRSIYGCTYAPNGLKAPQDCRYTYNPETKRLYLHLFAWPFKAVHLPEMGGKIKYAQLLNDASEIRFRDEKSNVHVASTGLSAKTPSGALTLEIPTIKPPVEVPVIEMFLK